MQACLPLRFPLAQNMGATSASKRFAVFTLAARQLRRQIATGGATGGMTKARLRATVLSLVHYRSDLIKISPAPALRPCKEYGAPSSRWMPSANRKPEKKAST